MAYAFSGINKALGEDEPQKADIFGNQGTQAGVQGGAPGGNAGDQVKTSTEGDLGSGGAASGSALPGQAPAPSLDTSQTAGRAADKAAAGKTARPKAFDQVSGQLDTQQKALQDESNQYVTNEKAKQTYDLGNPDIDKAVGGDTEAFGKVRGLLGRTAVNDIGQFDAKTNVDVADVDRLRSDAGLSELLRREQGPNYNKGEAAFDLRALRKTPGFDDATRELEARQESLRQEKLAAAAKARADVEGYGKERLTASQKAAQDYLGSLRGGIDAANAKEAADYKASIDKLRGGWGAAAQDVRQSIEHLRQTNPELAAYLARAGGVNVDARGITGVAGGGLVDPSKYVSYADTPGSDAFVDDNEARQFNAISQLLGKGDVRVAGARPTGPGYAFDKAAYEDAVRAAAAGLMPPPAKSTATGTGTTGTGTGEGTETITPYTPPDQPADAGESDDAKREREEEEKRKRDKETVKVPVPGADSDVPIGVTQGDFDKGKAGWDEFRKDPGKLQPLDPFPQIQKGINTAGLDPSSIAMKGVNTVATGVGQLGAGVGKVAQPAAEALGKVAPAVAKLDPSTAVAKIKANPQTSLQDILSNGKNSQFYAPGKDPRNMAGFWDAIKAGGYDTNDVDKLITAALSGKAVGNIPAALAAAQSKASAATKKANETASAAKQKAAAAAKNIPMPAVSGPAFDPDSFSKISAQINAAAAAAGKAGKDAEAAAKKAANDLGDAGTNVYNVMTGKKKLY